MSSDVLDAGEIGPFVYREDGERRAWGCVFPDGTVAMLWDRSAWAPENRLLSEHISMYGCVGDVLQANGGTLDWGEWEIGSKADYEWELME